MKNIILYFLAFFSLSLVFRSLFQFTFQKSFEMNNRIETFIGSSPQPKIENEKRDIESYRLVQKLTSVSNYLKEKLAKRLSRESEMNLEKKLREAGLSYNWTPVGFRFIQLLIGALLFSACLLLFGKATEKTAQLVFFAGTFGFLGYYYPNFYLSGRKKKRMSQIQKTLADFFDMVNLSVEAGMGLDAAIVRACKNTQGPLSEEFQRTIEEMRLGKSRRDAFIALRNRVPVDAFQSIMTSLIQADHLGIGMSKVLRTLTERIREHQRQLAREKAMKAPIKMLFPMVFFIFPAIFIVVLGPVIVHFVVNGINLGE